MFEQPKGNFQKIIETLEASKSPLTFDELLERSGITLDSKGKARLVTIMCQDGRFFYIKKTNKWHLKNKLPRELWFKGIDKYYEEDIEDDDQEERAMLNEEEGIEEVFEDEED